MAGYVRKRYSFELDSLALSKGRQHLRTLMADPKAAANDEGGRRAARELMDALGAVTDGWEEPNPTLMIRCAEHLNAPQVNESSGGSECGECAYKAGFSDGVASREPELPEGARASVANGTWTVTDGNFEGEGDTLPEATEAFKAASEEKERKPRGKAHA